MTPEPGPWRVRAEETLLDASPWLRVTRQEVELPDGRRVPDYYQVRLRDFALVYAEDEAGRGLFLRQYKHGLGRITLALPGGHLEPGEAALAAARRELREETGYEAASWTSLGAYVCDSNQGCGTGHLFLARGARRVGDPQAGDLEEQELVLLPRAQVRASLEGGEPGLLHHAAALALALLRLEGASA